MWFTRAEASRARRDPSATLLARHFVRHFLDSGFETVEGADGLRRVLLGVLSAIFAIGLFLPRMMAVKYYAARTPELYAQAIAGDTMMTLAFAMLAVAFAAALAGDAMFPNETDFRILTPLPITRAFIFAAKLRAVALYLGIVIIVITVGLQLPFTLVSASRFAPHGVTSRAAAHLAVGIVASLAAAVAVMSVQGVVVLGAPTRYLRIASVAARTAMLCGVIVLLPIAGRLPRQGPRFLAESTALYLVPPAWFAGLEQLVLGSADGYTWTLGLLAVGSSALGILVVAACYLMLYRRFDLVILRADSGVRHRPDTAATDVRRPCDPVATGIGHRSHRTATGFRYRFDTAATSVRHGSDPFSTSLRHRGSPHTTVIDRFARATLWRSPLHQVVFLGTTACGVGWAINSLLGAGASAWLTAGGVPPPRLVDAVVVTPFVLILAAATGLRAALLLPHDARANWVFRMNDRDDHRAAQLDAVERLFTRLALAPALAVTLPLAWATLGAANAFALLMLALCCGQLLVEVLVFGWCRIPFTCGYIPGKRHVVQTMLVALVTFLFFTSLGRALLGFSRPHPSRFLTALGFLLALLALVRHYRLSSWGAAPLLFDDEPAEMTPPLQLS